MHPAVEALFQRIHPLNERYAKKLWQAWMAAEPKQRSRIELAARLYLEKKAGDDYRHEPILLPPPGETDGDYHLGQVTYGEERTATPFGLREDDWIQHVAIFGRSGSGKTNLGAVIIRQLLEKKKPFLVIDWKRNYRDLLPRHPQLHILTAGRSPKPFQFNPFIPPSNTPADIWLKKIVEVLAHAYFAGEGVIDILMRAANRAYHAAGAYENLNYPTPADVRRYAAEIKESARQAQWKASALRILRSLDFGPMQRVTTSESNQHLDQLLTQPVILEVDALGESDRTFLAEALLLWIMQSRLRSETTREEFRHAIMIEEAHHLFLKRPSDFAKGEAVTDTLLREVRELGEAVILLDQHPSLISLPALGNTNTTVCFNLKTAQDVEAAAKALLLDRSQYEVLGKLPVGQAVARVQGRHSAPFTIKIPLIAMNKGAITDHDIKNHTPTKPESWIAARKPEPVLILTASEELLKDIALHPFSSVMERYDRLNVLPKHGRVHLEALLEKNLVQPTYIVRRRKKIKLLNLTEHGRKELDGLHISHSFPPYLEHAFWKKTIAETLQSHSYDIEEEHAINGYADIVAIRDSKRYAIEIETGKSDVLSNVAKCLESDMKFTKVICVATTKTAAKQFRPALKERGFLQNPRFTLTVARELDWN